MTPLGWSGGALKGGGEDALGAMERKGATGAFDSGPIHPAFTAPVLPLLPAGNPAKGGNMKAHRIIAGLLVAGAAIAACGGDGGSGPSPSQLAGSYNVTKCEYVSTTGLGTEDLIPAGGTGTLVLTTDSLYLTVTPASGPPVVLTATYEIDGIDLMRVTPAGASWYWAWDMTFTGNTLKLTGADSEYDFNNDGFGEPAHWNVTATR